MEPTFPGKILSSNNIKSQASLELCCDSFTNKQTLSVCFQQEQGCLYNTLHNALVLHYIMLYIVYVTAGFTFIVTKLTGIFVV